ncbi:translation protein SH3-like protein [Annulohypoxylon maeteangense]|uniref:translation protein SH3-like protein n=1 Tax=Annulohypoxylon maeteangense TaxID=1927788 RepID=UPI0020079FC4|nr:translation protein SH3-like protein [Annulohypoxylon maeteangense]KAI0885937.1 translation protein SH3-like protein [Annulohypoxylon maeteangense]
MGYYDESGKHHSFRHSLHKMADRVFHSEGDRVEIVREGRSSAPKGNGAPSVPNTVTIPCHHVRMGDILMLQGRPCQVIRISTSSATGQHRYLGVDLFTKQLHEESSFVSNPAPSVVVQTMLGPVFKQYRVLDIQDGSIVAMTETGDVKTGVPVIDQSNLWSRLNQAFNAGHGSVRVLVLNDGGRELVVDMKVIHASNL